jgi:crotonobetainyl-CoA:carnitine CoA-transferase CaiB-like acyl-CoA transferase
LQGVRVVDLGHHISGPLAALMLSDAGADVVHVDRPADRAHELPQDAFLNRGKRRITLDLKSPDDRRTARDLVARADVVIENFRPGVADRLGLGGAELVAAHPRLIHCALPAFGSWDPDRDEPGWEGAVQATAAGYRPLREHWDPTGRAKASVADPYAPLFTPIPTASNFSGLLGALSIAMALIARERTGTGQRVEVPMVEAAAEAYSTMISHRVYEDPGPAPNLMLPFMSHVTSDGRLLDGSPYPKFVIRLLQAAGVAEEWERQGLIDIASLSFALDRRDEVTRRFAEVARSHSGEWWDEVAARVNLPYALVRTPTEWARTAHARDSGSIVSVEDPLLGPTLLPGHGFDLEHGPGALQPRHRPDDDRASILAEAAAAPSRSPTSLGERVGRPLDGYRAIDITQAVAGPTAARLLADFGADVLKIGSPTPGVTDGIVGHLHNGKRTILMDIRAPQVAELTHDLFAEADAFVTNFSPASAERYGIDVATLRQVNPRLVYCTISAYGLRGPWAGRRAYENQNNAATGMSWRYGSQFGWALYQPSPITDAATGVLGAFATAVALYRRLETGEGQHVGSSLVQASTIQQGTLLVDEVRHDGGWAPSHGEYGRSARYRLYPGSDRSFFVAARADDLDALVKAAGLEVSTETMATASEPSGALALALAGRFATAPAAEWVTALRAVGVDATVVSTIDEAAAYLEQRDVVYFDPGPDGTKVPRPGISSAWLSATPPRRGPSPAPVGSQVIEILEEHGLTFEEIVLLNGEDVVCLPDQLPEIARWT